MKVILSLYSEAVVKYLAKDKKYRANISAIYRNEDGKLMDLVATGPDGSTIFKEHFFNENPFDFGLTIERVTGVPDTLGHGRAFIIEVIDALKESGDGEYKFTARIKDANDILEAEWILEHLG